MRRLLATVSVVLWIGLSLSSALKAAAPSVQLSVVTDRPEAVYSVGQEVSFLVTLKQEGKAVTEGRIGYSLSNDGLVPIDRGTVKIGAEPTAIRGTLNAPGFLRCQVSFKGPGGSEVTAQAGAGFDPQKIPPSLPVPDDFDAFWNAQKAKLAAVPMKPVLTPARSSEAGIECFDVQVPCVGPRPVSGYFARPAGAKPKSLPAILTVHGAGVGGSSLGGPVGNAKRPALAMDINAHGIPNGRPREFYADLGKGELNAYWLQGREDREKCYFLGMFLRLIRAIDFLTAQPEWDGKIVIVRGSSQGGGQSLAAAGLDPRVTFIAANVPAICDHSGRAAGRIAGWPKLVPVDDAGKPDPKILQVARYFDCMNLVTRAKAQAIVTVGFIDGTCPATSVYATYNNYAGPKQMIHCPLMGHRSTPEINAAFDKAIAQHIARNKPNAR